MRKPSRKADGWPEGCWLLCISRLPASLQCEGSRAVSRHKEIIWTKSEGTVASVQSVQQALAQGWNIIFLIGLL